MFNAILRLINNKLLSIIIILVQETERKLAL